jgi:hypothetical protein
MARCASLFFILLSLASPALAGWSEPVRISTGGYANPQIVALGDTLHLTYVDANNSMKIRYQRSTDGGETWGPAVRLSAPSDGTLFPRIVKSGNRLMVLWKKSLSGYYRYTVAYNTSTDNGQSWSDSDRFVLENGSPEDLFFSASGGTGPNVSLVYLTYVSPNIVFYSVRSTDFGGSWSAPSEIFRALESGNVDQAGVGNLVHVVWDGCFDPDSMWETRYVRSADGGLSWSDNFCISDGDGFGSYLPAICANGSGSLWLSCWISSTPPIGSRGTSS